MQAQAQTQLNRETDIYHRNYYRCLDRRRPLRLKHSPGRDETVYARESERRRTLRIKRSGRQQEELLDNPPSIKFAENIEELAQTFKLVQQVYLQKGFIKQPSKNKMLYSIYSLLPQSIHIIAKNDRTVFSNLTIVFDTPEFGLPMDSMYKKEVDSLRNKGRNVIELSALATAKEYRWKNIFHLLVQVMFWYSWHKEVDDLCITVNPRHVRYYKALFPFKEMGPEKYCSRVEAPAVPLCVDMEDLKYAIEAIGKDLEECDLDLNDYFTNITEQINRSVRQKGSFAGTSLFDTELVRYFIRENPEITADLTQVQKETLNDWYEGLGLGVRYSEVA